jgi:Kef-type K+ transport system membrane component KefB
MPSLDLFLMSLGGVLLLGLFTSAVSERTFLPRVTMLILFGVLIGDQGVGILPTFFSQHFNVVADLTLMMVGFLLGGKLCKTTFENSAKKIIIISVATVIVTALSVTLGLVFFGVDSKLAILLGTIASATAPAAIIDVVKESKIDNQFTDTLLSVVALDDVWALLLFAVSMAIVINLDAGSLDISFLASAAREIIGAIVLGVFFGVPSAYLSGRIRDGQPMMLEALGMVSLCGGAAIYFDVSYLIACIVMGAVVINLAKHHESPFHAIENIESLFLIVFFIVAGTSLELQMLMNIGYLGVAYIILRCAGKYFGAWIGTTISAPQEKPMRWMRFALLPQAGVSIGMALVATSRFPEYQPILITIVVGSTVFFELVGPIYTRISIRGASDAKDGEA